jgi:hypothetical protein
MRWLLVEGRDRKGPLFLVLRGDEPLPDYPGFSLSRTHTFDSKEQALAEQERRQSRPAPRTRPVREPRP